MRIIHGLQGISLSGDSPGADSVNDVLKIGEKWTRGTLLSGADGATITGVGVLRKLFLYNGTGSATVAQVYDGTSATGNKLTTSIAMPANSLVQVEFAAPFSIGVYVDFLLATSCEALGYYQAVS